MTDSPLQGSVVHQDPADGHGDPDLTRALEAFAPGPRELVSDLLARLATAR